LPRVPVPEDDLHELVRAVVARVVVGVARVAEVGRLGVVERGHDVPRGAAAHHVVEGREDPGDVEGLEVRRRVRAAQADVAGGHAHGGEQGDQVELDHADAVAHRLREVVAVAIGHGQPVVEERELELAGLERAADPLIVLGGEEVLRGRRVAPRGRVVRAVLGLQKGDQRHLPRSVRRHARLPSKTGPAPPIGPGRPSPYRMPRPIDAGARRPGAQLAVGRAARIMGAMRRRTRIALLLVALAALVAVGCVYRGYLAGILPSAAAEVGDIKLPPGFRIALYAAEVPNAREMALGPPGVVFVGSRDEGKVYALVDRAGAHRADEVHVLARGLKMPSGIAFRDGALYVA